MAECLSLNIVVATILVKLLPKYRKPSGLELMVFLGICPYYNKPSQEGLYQHFKAISQASPLPIVLYNVPGRTGVNMKPETIVRLARECHNIVGVKEASGSLEQVDEIIKNKPDGFEVISGDDALTFSMVASGAIGVISVIGNALPKEFSRMIRLRVQGRIRPRQNHPPPFYRTLQTALC